MRHRFSPTKVLFAGAVAALVAGCGTSPPARLYTLAPISQPATGTTGRQGAEPVSVTVAPVELPDYLDRSQIVTREGANALKLAEFHRWGGSLGDNITAVLVENLSGLLASDRVFASPGLGPEAPDFRVGVRILRLDSVPGGRVELKTQWVVTTGAEREEVATGLSTFTEPVADENYEALVAAVSRTVGQLSRAIAGAMAPEALSAAPPVQVRP
jgi:uncharacterized lipoprotein YmbA